MPPGRSHAQRGFTYLGVLVIIAVIGIGLTAASEVWLTTSRRERLAQADWAAGQIAAAIGSYYESSPAGVRAYPRTLGDLLQDDRFPTVRRHLRTVYPNPLAADFQWEPIKAGDMRIRGVRISVPWDRAAPSREYVYTSVTGG